MAEIYQDFGNVGVLPLCTAEDKVVSISSAGPGLRPPVVSISSAVSHQLRGDRMSLALLVVCVSLLRRARSNHHFLKHDGDLSRHRSSPSLPQYSPTAFCRAVSLPQYSPTAFCRSVSLPQYSPTSAAFCRSVSR